MCGGFDYSILQFPTVPTFSDISRPAREEKLCKTTDIFRLTKRKFLHIFFKEDLRKKPGFSEKLCIEPRDIDTETWFLAPHA